MMTPNVAFRLNLPARFEHTADITKLILTSGTNQLGPSVRCSGSAKGIAAIENVKRTAGQRGSLMR
jgi:hypothetical protein